MQNRVWRIDWRLLAGILLGALVGGLWAWSNLQQSGTTRDSSTLRPLIWAVWGLPAGSFLGWLLARPQTGWRAALLCTSIYLVSILLAARIERSLIGSEQARQQAHMLYYQSVLGLQTLGISLCALWQALRTHTSPEHEQRQSIP